MLTSNKVQKFNSKRNTQAMQGFGAGSLYNETKKAKQADRRAHRALKRAVMVGV